MEGQPVRTLFFVEFDWVWLYNAMERIAFKGAAWHSDWRCVAQRQKKSRLVCWNGRALENHHWIPLSLSISLIALRGAAGCDVRNPSALVAGPCSCAFRELLLEGKSRCTVQREPGESNIRSRAGVCWLRGVRRVASTSNSSIRQGVDDGDEMAANEG